MEQLSLTAQAGVRLHLSKEVHDEIVATLVRWANSGVPLMDRHQAAAHFSGYFNLPITIWHIKRDVQEAEKVLGRPFQLPRQPKTRTPKTTPDVAALKAQIAAQEQAMRALRQAHEQDQKTIGETRRRLLRGLEVMQELVAALPTVSGDTPAAP